MIELFWIVVILCIVCFVAVLALSLYVASRTGCVGCSCFFFMGFVAITSAIVGLLYGDEDAGYRAGVIGCMVSFIVYYGAVLLHDFFFCPYPARKKCTLRTCHPHYYHWVPIQDDIWYRECYVCHQEYVLFGFKYETTVNADGTLKPYLKRTKWGWRKDAELNMEVTGAVTPAMIEQARDKWRELKESLK